MKKIYTSIFLVFLVLSAVKAQKTVRIGYVDMNIVLSKNDNYKTSQKILDEKIEQWKKEIELRKLS